MMEAASEPASFRKQLNTLFERISQLEMQATPEPTPPPCEASSFALETPSEKAVEKPKTRAQRRAAPPPAQPKQADPLQAEIEALRKQFEKQARIIEEQRAPDPREAELRELKEKVRQQTATIQAMASKSSSQQQPSRPSTSRTPEPEPKPVSKPEAAKDAARSSDDLHDDGFLKEVDELVDQQAIVMPDGTKAFCNNLSCLIFSIRGIRAHACR